ncbi:CBO0543 family protein [Niallia sp. FSL R7-0271]|uniref:CBO0543 family protein n=1 Tax=Niallia sp. FSL R7-0271 TaxID=2921678 RepID=UPI0030F7DBE4
MSKRNELIFLRILFVVSIGFFLNLIRKPLLKDWLIIFLFKSYIASILDYLVVKKGYITYPVRIFKSFDISVLFSYLIFPVTCVYYNQATKNSKLPGILFKCLLFSLPSAVAEHFIEKHTKLVQYKKGWNSSFSFLSIAFTFLFVRTFISIVRKVEKA